MKKKWREVKEKKGEKFLQVLQIISFQLVAAAVVKKKEETFQWKKDRGREQLKEI